MPPVKKKLRKSLDSSFFEPKLQRDRRGSSANPGTTKGDAEGCSTAEYVSEEGDEKLDTDTKIALLAPLHPSLSTAALMDILLSTDGSIKATSQLLATGQTTLQARKPLHQPTSPPSNPLSQLRAPQRSSPHQNPTKRSNHASLHPSINSSAHSMYPPPNLPPTPPRNSLTTRTPPRINHLPTPWQIQPLLPHRAIPTPQRNVHHNPGDDTILLSRHNPTPPRAFTLSMSTAAGLVEEYFRTPEPHGRITAALVNCCSGP